MEPASRSCAVDSGGAVICPAQPSLDSNIAHDQPSVSGQQQLPTAAPEGDAPYSWRQPVLAAALRLLLAGTGAAYMLQQRIEVATPLTSLWRIREGLYLTSLGMSPYTGSAYHAPPLLLPLLQSVAKSVSLPMLALPYIAADICAAFALQRIAAAVHRPGSGVPSPAAASAAYLWNPFTLAACLGASSGCLENAAVLVAVMGGVVGDVQLAAPGLAAAAYLGLHPILLLAPLALLMWRGPEDLSVAAPATAAFAYGEPSVTEAAPSRKAVLAEGQSAAEGQTGADGSQRDPQSSQAAALPGPQLEATSAVSSEGSGLIAPPTERCAALQEQFQASFLARRRPGRRRLLTGFGCWTLVWMVALAALSDLSLRLYPEHWCQGFGLGSLMRAASIPAGVSCGGTHGGVGSAGAGAARGQHWLWETYGFTLRVGDLTPNIGLQWYLLTETFPHMRGAVAMLCPTLALVSALALSTRLAHRPLFLAALLCALSAMLKPYPSISDVGLYMGLLPLFWVQLRASLALLFLGSSLSLLAALGPAMWYMWIYLGSANANFYYAATLLFGAWQGLLIVSLVAATLRHDRLLAGKPVLVA